MMRSSCEENTIVLASGSKYRANLLNRLGLPFKQQAADIDESPLMNEHPLSLVERLSVEKALSIAKQMPNAWVIGSDQIALFQESIIGKPGGFAEAKKQLQLFSGNCVKFMTGLCLYQHSTQTRRYELASVEVHFKDLSDLLIENYLKTDSPYDCAGSFKVESLGVCLFDKVVSDDPTALEGLPLISLCKMFEQVGIKLFG
ncbi:septum formation protein Maf [Aliikangiella marina]|uniref:7-methyl-GTP pyrophosphatase n=1 Tax=Aliikangiella marina TaxID=1712262 RepID=A0A545TJP0_9GAMM|nr:nucleoside triphosphate pyrophosphatase [Aliikangiella marina]TQV77443.1 septum formation protein Maf [Aliikangiella marina]